MSLEMAWRRPGISGGTTMQRVARTRQLVPKRLLQGYHSSQLMCSCL